MGRSTGCSCRDLRVVPSTHLTNIGQFQSRRSDATFCPPQTQHAQNVGTDTQTHTGVGGGGREGERAKIPILTKRKQMQLSKRHKAGFLFGIEKIAAAPPHPSWGSAAGTQQGISCQLPISLIGILQQGPFPPKGT